MESAEYTIDWVAILGITGTLLGGIFGSLITFFIQKYSLEHKEKHRYQEARLTTYADLCSGATAAASASACGRDGLDAMKKYTAAHTLVNLIGSAGIRHLSGEVHAAFVELMRAEKPIDIEDPNTRSLNEKLVQFRNLARKELKVDEA